MSGELLLKGTDLLRALCPAVGIEFDNIRRIVLDVPFNGIPIVYAEMIGDKRLLNISQTLQGIELKVVKVEEKDGKV